MASIRLANEMLITLFNQMSYVIQNPDLQVQYSSQKNLLHLKIQTYTP